jgi:hypothetical protein
MWCLTDAGASPSKDYYSDDDAYLGVKVRLSRRAARLIPGNHLR